MPKWSRKHVWCHDCGYSSHAAAFRTHRCSRVPDAHVNEYAAAAAPVAAPAIEVVDHAADSFIDIAEMYVPAETDAQSTACNVQ